MVRTRILLTALSLALATSGSLVAATGSASAAPARHKQAHHKKHHTKQHKKHGQPPEYTPPPITWGACTSQTLQDAGAQCGMLTVPLDYDHPDGRTIQIAVSRVLHKTPDSAYQGVMLVNPGGPGGSGLVLSILGQFVPNGAGDPYDWIGFDPRGVGDSVPSLTCDDNYFPFNRPDYVPFTQRLERFWLIKSDNYARACARAGGDLLDHIKTRDNVADMDSLRKALGQEQLNFYGFSYGSYLGQVYATQHPDRVRRFVLDGVINPDRVFYQSNLDQDIAFEKTINIFFGYVAAHDDVYHLGATQQAVRKLWFKLLDKSRRHPFLGQIGPDEWTDDFQSAAYYVYEWADIADLFMAAANGNYQPAVDRYPDVNGTGPASDNGYSIYLGTQCTDTPWPQDYGKIRADNWRTYRQAPYFTWGNAQYNGPCRTWRGKADRHAPVVDGRNAPPILLIAETYDAATPYSGALRVRQLFPKSVLIEGVGGSTHAGSLSGVACTDNTIAQYLLDGTLPARTGGNHSDLQCPPVPAPDPNETAAASGSSRSVAPGTTTTGGLPPDVRKLLTSIHQ